jgi:hypothetical protein
MAQVIHDVCTAEEKKIGRRRNATITSRSLTPTAVLDDGDLTPSSGYQIHMLLSAKSRNPAARSHRRKAVLMASRSAWTAPAAGGTTCLSNGCGGA